MVYQPSLVLLLSANELLRQRIGARTHRNEKDLR